MLTKTPASERDMYVLCRMRLRDQQRKRTNTRRSAVNHKLPELFIHHNQIQMNQGKSTKCVFLPLCLLCMDSSIGAGTYCSLRFPRTLAWNALCTTCDKSVLTSRHYSKGQMFPLNTIDACLLCAFWNKATKFATNLLSVTTHKAFWSYRRHPPPECWEAECPLFSSKQRTFPRQGQQRFRWAEVLLSPRL